MRNKLHILRDTIFEDTFGVEGRDLNTWSLMYVDDLNIGEVNALECAQRHITEEKEEQYIHARYCEETFVCLFVCL